MENTKAKTINLLLEDGTLKGVMCIEDSGWNSGELYSAPRESIKELISSDACKKFGVYLLISNNMVYIGQSMDLATRIKQHLTGKDWWNRAIILTTKDDSLNRSDIDYLESVLIDKASKNHKLHCDNKKKGNPQKVTKFRKVELEQYLDEAFFLIKLIGVSIFHEERDTFEVQSKADAKELLKKKGILIRNKCNYARRQKKRLEYWINPSITVVDEEWDLILNDQYMKELIYIHIPAKTFQVRKDNDGNGFFVRRDKPEVIDLNIYTENLCDRRSGYDFSKYVVETIQYNNL